MRKMFSENQIKNIVNQGIESGEIQTGISHDMISGEVSVNEDSVFTLPFDLSPYYCGYFYVIKKATSELAVAGLICPQSSELQILVDAQSAPHYWYFELPDCTADYDLNGAYIIQFIPIA